MFMIEKMPAIRNPLSIIAIFAALSELSGTVVLPFIDQRNQAMFLWFLMLFPSMIVVLFFGTLWKKHSVLYAPTDFKDEANFLKMLVPASRAQADAKLVAEVEEATAIVASSPTDRARGSAVAENDKPLMQVAEKYRQAEELALRAVESQHGVSVQRRVRLPGSENRLLFDGVFVRGNFLNVVEIKFFSGRLPPRRIFDTLFKMIHDVYLVKDQLAPNIKIHLVLVDLAQVPADADSIKTTVSEQFLRSLIPVEVTVYNLQELRSRFEAQP